VSGSFAPSMGSISTVRWKRPRVGVSSNSTHFDEAVLIEAVADFLGQLEGLRSNR
jgi:hypothetical protein